MRTLALFSELLLRLLVSIPPSLPSLDFEFIPSYFLEPRAQLLALQTELVHSQMFHALMARCQERDEKVAASTLELSVTDDNLKKTQTEKKVM